MAGWSSGRKDIASIPANAATTGKASNSSLRMRHLRNGAQRLHAGAAQQVGKPYSAVGAFELAGNVIQAVMKRAERFVPGQAQGTTPDPANRLNGIDDGQNGDTLGRGHALSGGEPYSRIIST